MRLIVLGYAALAILAGPTRAEDTPAHALFAMANLVGSDLATIEEELSFVLPNNPAHVSRLNNATQPAFDDADFVFLSSHISPPDRWAYCVQLGYGGMAYVQDPRHAEEAAIFKVLPDQHFEAFGAESVVLDCAFGMQRDIAGGFQSVRDAIAYLNSLGGTVRYKGDLPLTQDVDWDGLYFDMIYERTAATNTDVPIAYAEINVTPYGVKYRFRAVAFAAMLS